VVAKSAGLSLLLTLIKTIPVFEKDSRAAEGDIGKVIAGADRFLLIVLFEWRNEKGGHIMK
jgi:hypothetical protein